MNIQVKSPGIKVDIQLENGVIDKMEWLEKKFPRIDSAIVTFKELMVQKKKFKVVEVKMNVPGGTIFISERAESFEAAFKRLFDVLLRRLKKEYHKYDHFVHKLVGKFEKNEIY